MHHNIVLLFSVWVVLIILARYRARAQLLDPPASDFNRHSIVQPIVHHGRTRREIRSTRDTNGAHHQEVTMTVNVDGKEYKVDLQLNYDLVAGDHAIRYQKKGKTVTQRPNKEEIELCHYSGVVRDKPGSWAAVSTCRGVSGVIHDGQHMRYIEPADSKGGDSNIQSKHYLYSHSDLNTIHKCGHGGVTNNTTLEPELRDLDDSLKRKETENNRVNRYKRSIDGSRVRAPNNSNKLSRYVELVLVADHGEYVASGRNLRTTHTQLIQLANIINSLYSPLNIFIALVGVEVWTERNQIQLSEDPNFILRNFHKYRTEMSRNGLLHDNAHLLTRQKFWGTTVGLASTGGICRDSYSGGVAYHHSDVIGPVASTIAHEMGHNLGMRHDTRDCDCPDRFCIMSDTIILGLPTSPSHWSSCSRETLADTFKNSMDFCLHNKPQSLFGSANCGNGFVEVGEQCDCGLNGDTACLACCDARTCKLRSNATCGAGECCDLTTCNLKSAGTVCRSADKECDLPEHCTGHSEYCPDDVYKMNSLPCGKGDDQAYCVDGSCRSHNDHCRLLYGPTGTSHPKCYHHIQRQKDKRMGCGLDSKGRPICEWTGDHAMCARISCSHPNVQIRFTEITYHLEDRGISVDCPVSVDMGPNSKQFGLVPDGAKCGDNKMCMKQRCVSVESVRKEMYNTESSVCPSNCSGHGVCNSLGRCNCESGYEPPRCDVLQQIDPISRRQNDHNIWKQSNPNINISPNEPDRRQKDPNSRRQNDLDHSQQDPNSRRQNDPDRSKKDPNSHRQNDPDRNQNDPDSRRQNDPDSNQKDPNSRRQNDPDLRPNDLDIRRQNDPDSRQKDPNSRRQNYPDRKPNDPNVRRQNDPDLRPNDLDIRRQNDPDRRQKDPNSRRQYDPDRRPNDPNVRRQNDPNRNQKDSNSHIQNDPDRRPNDHDIHKQNDPDRRQKDPISRRQNDPGPRQKDPNSRRQNYPDRRQRDPNSHRHNDPDRRPNDPNNRRPSDPFDTTRYNPVNPSWNVPVIPRQDIFIEPRWKGHSTDRQDNPNDTRWNDSVTPRQKNSSGFTRKDTNNYNTVSHGTERTEVSKPDKDLTDQRDLKIALYVIFLGVLPAGVIVFFLFYYLRSRHDAPRWWRQPQSPHLRGLLFKNIQIPNIFNRNPTHNVEQTQSSTDVHRPSNQAVTDAKVTETVRKITKDDIKIVYGVNIPPPVNPKPFVNPLDTCIPLDKPNPLVNLKPIVNPKPLIVPTPLDNPKRLVHLKPVVKPKPFHKPMPLDNSNKLMDSSQLSAKLNPLGQPNIFNNQKPDNPNLEAAKGLTSITNELLSKHRLRSVGDNRYKKFGDSAK